MTTYQQTVDDARATEAELVRVDSPTPDRAIVTLDDPRKLNVLSAALCLQLKDRLDALLRDPSIRTIVLTGADPGFSAGGDLRLMRRDRQHQGARRRGGLDDGLALDPQRVRRNRAPDQEQRQGVPRRAQRPGRRCRPRVRLRLRSRRRQRARDDRPGVRQARPATTACSPPRTAEPTESPTSRRMRSR